MSFMIMAFKVIVIAHICLTKPEWKTKKLSFAFLRKTMTLKKGKYSEFNYTNQSYKFD
jgi:hypothetical protein